MIDRLVKITVWLTDAHGVTFNPTDPFNRANGYLDMQSGDDFQVEFNQDDTARVDHFTMFADGNGLSAVGFPNPDNTDTSSNSLMVHDDRSNARIWRHDYDTRVWRLVDCRRQEGRVQRYMGDSKWIGNGAWTIYVRACGSYESRRLKGGLLLKREAEQLLLMKIPDP